MDNISKVTLEEKTDFEKLVQAQQYIKHLKIEEGKNASYIMELEEEIKSLKEKEKSSGVNPDDLLPVYIEEKSKAEISKRIRAQYNKLVIRHQELKREFKIYKEKSLQTIIKLQLKNKNGE